MVRQAIAVMLLSVFLAACASPTPTAVPTAAPTAPPTSLPAGFYRPLQKGDLVEGEPIDYTYTLPSETSPAIQIALGQNILNLVSVNPQMSDGLVAFAREIAQKPYSILAFDENQPNQVTPTQVTLTANRPIEFVVIKLPDVNRNWSIKETQENSIRGGYKLVRRADGGLRFILAYDVTALQNFGTFLPAGRGGGLVLSSRLALLKLVLEDPRYQRGADVFEAFPPDVKSYDARVLKLDPSKEGLDQNVDWALVSRPGPGSGLQTAP